MAHKKKKKKKKKKPTTTNLRSQTYKNKKPKINRINFEKSDNVLKCL